MSRQAPSGLRSVVFSTKGLPPGEYEVRAKVFSPRRKRFGGRALLRPVSIVPVTIKPKPPWLRPENGVKVLNNFVIQLLTRDTVSDVTHTEYKFHNPRDGWIFIRIDGALKEGQLLSCSLDDAKAENAVLTHQDLRGRKMLPVHWATFNLAIHDWDEPIRRAIQAASKESVAQKTAKKASKKTSANKSRAPVSEQYHRAEACYRQLLDNPKKQKYRDRWLPCRVSRRRRESPNWLWSAQTMSCW